ncbi:EAL domain-containing protein [Patescibacteria group bacterium]|nr:EAL domain-containing protein [Patescibacteria group bacterium]
MSNDKVRDFFERYGIEIFPTIVQKTHNSVIITDSEGKIFCTNDSFTRITGYTGEEAVGQTPSFLRAPGMHTQEFYNELWKVVVNTGQWKGEIWSKHKSGKIYPGDVFLKAIVDPESKKIISTFAVMRDLSKEKEAEESLKKIALHDPLTCLPNRLLFNENLQRTIAEAARNKNKFALLFIDLNEFKIINDTLGHSIGDFTIQEFSRRLQECLRDIDFIARIGGDEFIVILKDIKNAQQAAEVADKILNAMKPIARFEGQNIAIKGSIGIAIYPDDGSTQEDIISSADHAMYSAKKTSKSSLTNNPGMYKFFDPKMSAEILRRDLLRYEIKTALGEKNEFFLEYQPQVTRDHHVIGIEALIRWKSPSLGLVSPVNFIPAAEEMNLITNIGAWVINRACCQLNNWQSEGFRIPVSIIVSAKQLEDKNFANTVARALGRHGVDPKLLILEITESQIITQKMLQNMHTLKEFGLKLDLDDFGTEYSNLKMLTSLPWHALKIDQSFTKNTTNTDSTIKSRTIIIIRTIERMARSLDIMAIVEGVETQEQLNIMIDMGFENFQGFYFHRPMTPDRVKPFLHKG